MARHTPEMLSRDRLALALDTPDLDRAIQLSDQLSDFFGVLKIGLTLWAAEGPNAVKKLQSKERQIFLDLKLHDIPHQVGEASKHLSRLKVDYITMHSAGGRQMLEAGVAGFQTGSHPVNVLAVTVLTSHSDLNQNIFLERVELAREAGCGGIVCSVNEVALAKSRDENIFCAVPGIRNSKAGAKTDDQARPGTVAEAIKAGSDLLVIGRPVTQADNSVEAAKKMLALDV